MGRSRLPKKALAAAAAATVVASSGLVPLRSVADHLADGKRLGTVYTPVHTIGSYQQGGSHYKPLSGILPGFTVGQSGTGTMKTAMDAYETLIGDYIEAVGIGLPNQMGDPGTFPYLSGETRHIVFAAPLIPLSGGSINRLLANAYDGLIRATAQALMAAGLTNGRASIRVGWEFNSGATSFTGFQWSTGHTDPQTGNLNGLANVKLAQAHYETVFRSALAPDGVTTWQGYIEWNAGNADSSSASVSTAMPTHGDPSNSMFGWDIYSTQGGSYGKDNETATWAVQKTYYQSILNYCAANGYLMCHGEYGHTYKASSPYSINDELNWFRDFYQIMAANPTLVAYAMHYQQNQPYVAPGGTPVILDESHQIAYAGSQQGSRSTVKNTGPYAVGSSTIGSTGSAHTTASMGSLHNGDDTPSVWVFTNDANKGDARDSWMLWFGGSGGNGAAGLAGTPVAPPPPAVVPAVDLDTPTVLTLVWG